VRTEEFPSSGLGDSRPLPCRDIELAKLTEATCEDGSRGSPIMKVGLEKELVCDSMHRAI
jgi:hypothetical protein